MGGCAWEARYFLRTELWNRAIEKREFCLEVSEDTHFGVIHSLCSLKLIPKDMGLGEMKK